MTTEHDPLDPAIGERLARQNFYPVLVVTALYTLAMHFVLPCEWASGSTATTFVAGVAGVVPMLRALAEHSIERPCFLFFVAGFWCIAPVFVLLGIRFVVNGGPGVHARIRGRAATAHTGAIAFCAGLFALVYCTPLMHGLRGMNDGTGFLPLQLMSWGMVAVVVWMQGLMLGSCWIRFRSHG